MSGAVYLGYSQAELDAQYDQRTLVSDLRPYLEQWRIRSEAASRRYAPETDIPYGEGPGEVIDLFRPEGGSTRLHLHYHGGAWRRLSSRDAWFVAPPWVEAGYNFASVNFALVPEVSLATQVDQARRALQWCADQASSLGMDPEKITVSGHSSGAHLAALVALADWGRPQPPVQAAIIASGSYDLEPVRLSARNEYLRLSPSDAAALSPSRHLNPSAPPCVVMWSLNELAEFQRQGECYAALLARRGTVVRHAVDTESHFDTWGLITPDLIAPFGC